MAMHTLLSPPRLLCQHTLSAHTSNTLPLTYLVIPRLLHGPLELSEQSHHAVALPAATQKQQVLNVGKDEGTEEAVAVPAGAPNCVVSLRQPSDLHARAIVHVGVRAKGGEGAPGRVFQSEM
jgi:hypothetical protein